jgi:hypothetical protein
LDILGKEQAGLIQNIGTDILTPFRRDRVYDKIAKATEKLRSQLDDEIIRRERLDAQLANKEITEDQYQKQIEKTIITEDQYRKRLEALREKILLDQRRAGGIFAEDFRGGRQEARESRILGQQTQLEDFGAAFFDEFDNRTEDSYREAQMGAKETARTIKSEFNNAFLSFANGTETASDAFTKMALNISDKIQQLSLEFASNQIFGSLFGSTSNIFGGGGGGIGDFFGSLFKSKGGMIKGYSSGGNVTGGSGTRDDIPAMLSAGEYVIRKSAVKKYGPEYLQMLNEGKVQKNFFGGAIGPIIANQIAQGVLASTQLGAQAIVGLVSGGGGGATISEMPGAVTPTPTSDLKNKKVKKFANGGEAKFIGANNYRYNDANRPTAGENVIDERLSLRAITDENNPQNQRRIDREAALYDYLNYVESVQEQNREAYAENQRINREIRDEYNRQKNAKLRGALYSFGLGVVGAGLNQFGSMGGFKGIFGGGSSLGSQEVRRAYAVNDVNPRPAYGNTAYKPTQAAPYSGGRLKLGRASGGYIRGFANGGSSGKDDIPALLMDGEFVMRKQAVNSYGKKFFDDLNTGRVKKFANGGIAGNSLNELNKNIASNPTNNINITVNVANGQAVGETSQDSSQSAQDENQQKNQEAKSLAALIKNQVIEVITQQQRPGGILRR